MSKTTSKDVPENVLAAAWRHLDLGGAKLVTASGQNLQIVFPGRRTGEAGPDFRGAILATETGELLTGDVEVDVHSSFWRKHGHQTNPSYQQVALQVVLRHDRGAAPLGAGAVPVLEIAPGGQLSAVSWQCPALARGNAQQLTRLIGWAGELRFRTKSQRFYQRLERITPGQVLYEGLMESLGYSHNQAPFRWLAARLPLKQISPLTAGRCNLAIQSLLLGSAGLLPSQSDASVELRVNRCPPDRLRFKSGYSGFVDNLEREWLAYRRQPLLRRQDWHFFQVRPVNTPPRRLAAAAFLLAEKWLPDPAASLMPLLDNMPVLEKSLAAPAGDSCRYWEDHLDFGVPSPYCHGLLGPGRRRDMVINIVLPFFYAWGCLRGWQQLRSRVRELYLGYPPGADNTLLRLMRERLKGLTLEAGARQQQGLLHLYHRYCHQRRCSYCPLLRAGGVEIIPSSE